MYRFQIRGWRCSHYFFDDTGNILEADLLLQKRSHRDFVGGVESNGLCASRLGRLVSQCADKEIYSYPGGRNRDAAGP